MRFTIQPALFDLFPGLAIPVVVARGIDNRRASPEIDAAWSEAWSAAAAAEEFGNAQSHPRIRPWRERFRALGVSGKDFPSSVEALLRRALKGGEPFSINPIVDFYNTVSLRHCAPAGAFDLDDLAGDLQLRLTRPGDTFWSLDAAQPVQVSGGEVAYADRNTILTRHFVWRQARAGLVTRNTRNVVLLAEVLGEVGRDVADDVLNDFASGIRRYFDVEPAWTAITGEGLTDVRLAPTPQRHFQAESG